MAMGGSTWGDAKENLRSAKLGLAILTASFGSAVPALAQENVNSGQSGAQISQRVKNAESIAINGVSDLLNKWTPEQNLYVQGEERFQGFNKNEQDALAQWLAVNRPNWTVVFVGNASNQNYQGNSNEKAYEFAIGQTLMGSNKFSGIKDKESDLKSGATLLIVASPNRWMAWGSSQLQEKHGLDYHSRWVGGFDEILKSELRRSRWADGVKKVTDAIDGELEQKINQERQQAARQFSKAQESVNSAKSDLENLPLQLEAFRKNYPGIKSELAFPNTTNFTAQLERAEKALKEKNITEANQLSQKINQSIQSIIGRMNQYSADGKVIEALPNDIATAKKLNFHQHGDAQFNQASLLLQKTIVLWKAGDPEYSSLLKQTNSFLTQGITAVDNATKGFSEVERLSKEIEAKRALPFHQSGDTLLNSADDALMRAKNDLSSGSSEYSSEISRATKSIQNATDAITGAQTADTTKKASLALAVVAISGFLGWKNFSRKSSKVAALEQYALIDKAIAAKSSELMALDERAALRLKNAKLIGATAELSQEILQGIPPLYVMITSAQEVLDKAETLIKPKSFFGKVQNVFSSKNYEAVTALLETSKVKWDQDSQLPDVIRGKPLQSQSLWADLSAFEDFEMSFKDLLEHFNASAQNVDQRLTTLDNAYELTSQRASNVEASISTLKTATFPTPITLDSIQKYAIPSIETHLKDAQAIMFSDPLTSNELLTTLEAEIAKPLEIVAEIQNASETHFNTISANQKWLEENNLGSDWLQFQVTALQTNLNLYLQKTFGEESSLEEIPNIAFKLETIAALSTQAVAQGSILRTKYPETKKGAEDEVAAARARIMKTLSLTAGQVFAEKDEDPDVMIEKANTAATNAEKMISAGNLEQAEKSIIEASDLFAQARRLAAMSLDSLDKQKELVEAISKDLESLRSQEPQMKSVLEAIKTNYAESVLLLSSGDPTHPRVNNTVGDNIAEVESTFSQITRCLQESQEAHKSGELLHAAALIRQAQGLVAFATFRYQEITEKHDRLVESEASNATHLGSLNKSALELQADIDQDKIIGNKTVEQFNTFFRTLNETINLSGKKRSDPFSIESSIVDLQKALSDVRDLIADDRENYHSAVEALGNARRELLQIESQIDHIESADAGISTETKKAKSDLEQWQGELTTVDTLLKQERGDWSDVARQADRVVRKGAEILARIQDEAEELDEVLNKMKAAEKKIREARSWSGSYGVRVSGSPGQNNLASAQGYLQRGDYDQALAAAVSAYTVSSNAIEEAENTVRRKRREEEEEQRRQQEEEDRRRRQRQQEEDDRRRQSSYSSSSSSSSSDSGMSGSSFSSSSSDSGMGGSSW
jgi:DNA repair exonuclease SbcCD ATPase subunit